MSTINKSLNADMLRDPRWQPHPERAAGGTKYISTFHNRRGDAIALDLGSGGKNAVWVAAHLAPGSLIPAIERELYPADKPRNSNLNVTELKGKALMRLFPTSLSQARQLVEHFAQL
ncbi:hypothetical protein [Devosia rhizoryzae]|uniref:Uncharacterized protein n=1 Tax=Devosia rhizoryzae TaxID=2774137 RepID=A0ABX7C736_9HYPH|nr:hypothetical protein [Devosia rhizoryzae]QQR39009.1 hypothetical protein JI748_14875 [Devosia rhizoryzae]